MSTVALQEIEAETQIFTPPYVAKFLAQNSIGRLWINSHPNGKLANEMGWWVASNNPAGLATVESPEEIRVIDPACGTGNLLIAAFDVLYDIYMDAGYEPDGIPALIFTHNLVGRDIDPGAAAAANAVLVAKAHSRNSHFFRYQVVPDVRAFTEVDHPQASLLGTLLRGLDQSQYHVVLANPPYMGRKHFTPDLKRFAQAEYPDSRGDLCTMFMDRSLEMLVPGGLISMITMESWMFLSSFETLRRRIQAKDTIITMAHLGHGVFGSGAVIRTTAFVIANVDPRGFPGVYFRLVDSKHKERDLHLGVLNYRIRQTFAPQKDSIPPPPKPPGVQVLVQAELPLWEAA